MPPIYDTRFNNTVDKSNAIGYNTDNNDANDIVIQPDALAPLNDTECKHETLVPDPDDTLGDAVYHGCANPKCGIGFYIRAKES